MNCGLFEVFLVLISSVCAIFSIGNASLMFNLWLMVIQGWRFQNPVPESSMRKLYPRSLLFTGLTEIAIRHSFFHWLSPVLLPMVVPKIAVIAFEHTATVSTPPCTPTFMSPLKGFDSMIPSGPLVMKSSIDWPAALHSHHNGSGFLTLTICFLLLLADSAY